jgi:hypothetical protein
MKKRNHNVPEPSPKPQDVFIPPSAKEVFDSLVPEPETRFQRVCREQKITQEAFNKQPRVTAAMNDLPGTGGFDVLPEYLRGNEDPDAIKFMEKWDSISLDDKECIGFEGVCAAAGVPGKKLFGIIVSEALTEGESKMALHTALKAPAVIAATLKRALTDEGHREKVLVAKASGWLPRPKGSQTNININNGRINQGNTTNLTLPAFDVDIRELGERFQEISADAGPKLLEGSK